MGVFYTFAGLQWMLDHVPELTVIGTALGLTSGSTVSTDTLATPTGLKATMELTSEGTDLTSGTTVESVDGNTVNLSAAALATASAFPVAGFSPSVDTEQLTLHLLTGAIPQGLYTLFAALTEATYDGYAAEPITFDGIVQTDGAAYAWLAAPCQTWAPTDYTIPNTITGQAWTIPGGGENPPILIATEIFVTPINLSNPGDVIKEIPILPLPNDVTAGPASPIIS